QRIEAVVPESPVKSVRDVVTADVPIAGPAEISDIQRVRREDADRIRPNEEVVLIEVERRTIMVVMNAELGRVAGKEEILPIIVGDVDVLMAALERVQFAIGILLLLIEPEQVELIAVGQPRAEDADGPVGVAE